MMARVLLDFELQLHALALAKPEVPFVVVGRQIKSCRSVELVRCDRCRKNPVQRKVPLVFKTLRSAPRNL
jgi:hypothetical protein